MSERISRREALRRAGLTAGAMALGPALAHMGRTERALAQASDTLIYGMASPFDTLDTTVTTSSYTGRMGLHVVDPLVWSVKSGEYAPGLATSWSSNADATAYTFNLREDVKFHDGTPFNAESVKVTFDRIVDPNTKAQTAFSFIGPYDRTEVLAPYQVRVRFKRPYANFLNAASTPYLGIISPTALRRYGADFGPVVFVSTGPFSIQTYRPGQEISLVRNINYNWASRVQKHNGPPHLKQIVFRTITEPSTRLATLETGETHFIEDIPPNDLERVKRNQRITVIDVPQAGSGWSVMFNQQRPPTNELAVRRAFQLTIDKEALTRSVWAGVHKPACSPLTPNLFGFDAETCKKYPRNVDQARRVLEEAGWTMGPDGIRVKGGQRLVVAYHFRTENPKLREMTAFIQAQMRPVGVEVQLVGAAGPAYFQAVRSGLHNVQYWWDTGTDPGQMLRILFHSSNAGGGTNRNNYRNADMDKLIDDIGAEANPQKRRELLARAQNKVLDEQIMVFLTDPPSLYAHQRNVSGIWVDWGGLYPYFYDARIG